MIGHSDENSLNFELSSAPGGDLQTLIDGDLVPLEGDVVHFVRQLVEGLAYLHQRNIAHLDIKVSSTHKRSKRTCHASRISGSRNRLCSTPPRRVTRIESSDDDFLFFSKPKLFPRLSQKSSVDWTIANEFLESARTTLLKPDRSGSQRRFKIGEHRRLVWRMNHEFGKEFIYTYAYTW